MLEILKAILYGIVEGITEWLPISSTGHLILLKELIPLSVSDEFWTMFEVVIQLGAIGAVIVLFFHKLNPFSPQKTGLERRKTWDLWGHVIVAVIPAGVLGVLLDDWLDAHLYNYITVAVTLILYGVAFLFLERNRQTQPTIRRTGDISWSVAVYIGLFQCLSMIPGTSRSGATILGAMLLGLSRGAAAEFSFFLAIPHHAGGQPAEGAEVYQGRRGDDRPGGRHSDCGLRGGLCGVADCHPVPDELCKAPFLCGLRRVPHRLRPGGFAVLPAQPHCMIRIIPI